MILIKINHQSKEPLFKQVEMQIKELIDNKALKPGDKLPSSRALAKKLEVHRTTIYKAYEELWALGYIESRPGSYSVIRKRVEIKNHKSKVAQKLINWEEVISSNARSLVDNIKFREIIMTEKDSINFLPLSPDPSLMPVQEFRMCLNHVLKNEGAQLLQYGESMGYKPLRELIADQMKQHSISISADEILITNGAQNAIELILKLLVEKGRKIIVENPTYSSVIPLFKYYNADIIGISTNENGLDLDSLKKKMSTIKPAFLYTIPNFQNPTGITTNQEHRENLLKICEENLVPLVEDGFEEEMKYFGKSVLPIKSMDAHDVVIYIGTFSKILFPGLRIGWIAADKNCIQKLMAIKKACDISGNSLNQAALYHFCKIGKYEMHIKQAHKIYRKRMQTALKFAKEYFPVSKLFYTKPLGGYTIWVEMMNVSLTEDEIIRKINKNGALVTPGKLFFTQISDKKAFRISIAHLNETEIEEGMKRIGITLHDIIK